MPPSVACPDSAARRIARAVLAVLYGVAGILHLIHPAPFLSITPGWVPMPDAVVALTGVAELLGAAALLQPASPALRRLGAWGLAAYAVAVFPANIHHFALDRARPDGGLGLAYHVPRLCAQPVIVWWALWAGGVTDWPWGRSRRRR